jgi:hypothetical protein
LIPTFQPLGDGAYQSARKKNSTPVGKAAPLAGKVAANVAHKTGVQVAGKAASKVGAKQMSTPQKGRMLTQHTGLPPRVTGSAAAGPRKAKPGAAR